MDPPSEACHARLQALSAENPVRKSPLQYLVIHWHHELAMNAKAAAAFIVQAFPELYSFHCDPSYPSHHYGDYERGWLALHQAVGEILGRRDSALHVDRV